VNIDGGKFTNCLWADIVFFRERERD